MPVSPEGRADFNPDDVQTPSALLPLCAADEFVQRFGVHGARHSPAAADAEVSRAAAEIIQRVRQEGDGALVDLTEQLDGPRLDRLVLPADALQAAWDDLPAPHQQALTTAARRIRRFHQLSAPRSWLEPTGQGGWWGQIQRPVARAGIYAPGGRYPYPSTVLMGCIPAQVAGVPEIIVATPPGSDGTVDQYILAAAHLAGVQKVVTVGGAQAVAALAFGTESVPRCDLVVGPGNAYVTAAKALVYGQVGIDGLMGPSELAVVADTTAEADWVAADLAAQAEHGPDSPVCLLTTSAQLARAVQKKLGEIVEQSPAAAVLRQSLARGAAVLVEDTATAIDLANNFAPEHLQLYVDDAWSFLGEVKNAGAVYIGPWAPVALGDYAAGPNHILPTGNTARYSGGLTVATFLRPGSLYVGSEEELLQAGPAALHLANSEGLQAHAQSIQLRLDRAAAQDGDES